MTGHVYQFGVKPYDPERIFTIALALLAFLAIQNDYPATASLLIAILIIGTLLMRAVFRDAGES